MTEKQAGIGSLITRAKRVVPSVGISTGTAIQKKVGSMVNVKSTLPNKYLSKVAELSEGKKELLDTGVIAAGGVASSIAGNHILSRMYKGKTIPSMAAGVVGGGLGVLADYGAVKLNKAFGHKNNESA